jgi:hypothetical protein
MSDGKRRYLVAHDYGMGALWLWVRAGSATEIVVEVGEAGVRCLAEHEIGAAR